MKIGGYGRGFLEDRAKGKLARLGQWSREPMDDADVIIWLFALPVTSVLVIALLGLIP